MKSPTVRRVIFYAVLIYLATWGLTQCFGLNAVEQYIVNQEEIAGKGINPTEQFGPLRVFVTSNVSPAPFVAKVEWVAE
jgi:hypothetical protein